MGYKELLLTNKIVRQLSIIQFVAYFGAWFSNVAIYSMLIEFEASPFLISLVVATNFLPAIILSPLSGSFVDRLPIKKFMIFLLTLEMTMTLCFLLINSIDDIWLLIILLFIRMGCASTFFTTEMSLLPKLLDGELLTKANEIHSMIWSFTFTAGMAIGGFVVYKYGTTVAFIIDSLFFFTALIILINTHFDIEQSKKTQHILLDIKDGFHYLKSNKKLIHLILLHASVGITSFDALITLLADYHYKYILSVPLAIGITNATRSLALMIGPFLITNWINKDRLFYLFIFQGIAIILWAILEQNFYIALFGIFLTGIATTTIWSYTYAMLQEEIDNKFLGRVLSYNEMVFMSANILTTMFIGIAASFISLSAVTVVLGVSFFGVAYYYKRVFL
ncbi:MAG: MFS transporter [Arcobacteraceae bacterium]|nr:MFS transporter [Arcobacteraceae bacterium]